MRDRGLGKMNPSFDIGGAQALIFANRGSATLFERLQNPAPSGVGDGMQGAIQSLLRVNHDLAISQESMVVNLRKKLGKVFDMMARRDHYAPNYARYASTARIGKGIPSIKSSQIACLLFACGQ
jgi:hypothetical protein